MTLKNTENIGNNADTTVHYKLAEDLVRQAQAEGMGIEQLLNNLTKKVVELSLEAELTEHLG